MACCGLTCEYIYAKLDAAESNKSGAVITISSNLLLKDDESCQTEIQLPR